MTRAITPGLEFKNQILLKQSKIKNTTPVRSFLSKNPVLLQFIQFAAVGVIGTIAHFSTLIALVSYLKVQAVLASACGFVTGAFMNYSLNYAFTFRSNKKHTEAFTKFFLVALVGLAFNSTIMAITTTILSIHYILGQVIATGFVLIWNFTGSRLWAFQE